MKKLIIFGTGKISEAVSYFFNRDSDYEICAYVCDKDFLVADAFLGRPVISTDVAHEIYPAKEFYVFVAIGYQGMNAIRAEKVSYFKGLGYKFANYVTPVCDTTFSLGENSIVMDGAVIQPCVSIGNNVFVWGGTLIGHHAAIHDNCWLTGSCSIGGLAKVGKGTFIGLNATIGNEILIGNECMIGAGTLCCKDIPSKSVLVAPDTEIHRMNSEQFSRFSSCFRL
jgi:sugar O-acyltransferase (sialic acid O-acetyltransferase NeuD family)